MIAEVVYILVGSKKCQDTLCLNIEINSSLIKSSLWIQLEN